MRAIICLYTTFIIGGFGAVLVGGTELAAADQNAVVSGSARVIDADTIAIHGARIRLDGIDAPEKAQKCPNRLWGAWPCGRQAIDWLETFIGQRDVACRVHGRDSYKRLLATCAVGGVEINRTMVRQGMAWAFVKYSRIYVAEQRAAKAERLGVWSGATAEPPWSFRQRRWAIAEQRAPAGCAIKGNISRRGKVYHPPWSSWYNRVRITEARGERWFCTEGEAVKAGWRPAYGS